MTLRDRCHQIIRTADPSVHLDDLSRQDIVIEAINIAQFAVEQMAIAQKQRVDSESSALLLVPESVLVEYGVPIHQLGLETYDSNPTIAHFDAFPIVKKHVKHQGLRIGITHIAGQDHRFGMLQQVDYGHLMGSYGQADDGQSHDFLVGTHPTSEKFYAIQQLDPETGEKDERKFGIHFPDAQSFKAAYQGQLPASLRDKMFGGVWEVSIDEFQSFREDAYHTDSCGCEACAAKQEQKIETFSKRKRRKRLIVLVSNKDDRVDAAKLSQEAANFNDEDNGNPCNDCKNWLGLDKQQPTDGGAVRNEHIPVGRCRLVQGQLWELASCDYWESAKGDRADDKAADLLSMKLTQEETNYNEDEPIDQGLCGECVYYQPGDGDFGSCSLVEGKIWQLGHCDEFIDAVSYTGLNDRADASEASKPYLVWFSGRRTPIAIRAKGSSQAVSKARKLKRRGGDAVAKVRQATESEQKTAASGGWIRTGPNGEKPGYNKNKKGFGPTPKRDSGGREPELDEESDRSVTDSEGRGERCGEGWISPGEDCHAGEVGRRSSGRQIRIPPGYDSGYILPKRMSLGDGSKFDSIPNPERDLAKKFYTQGLTSDLNPKQLELLKKNPKALVAAIEGWDRGARSLLTEAKAREAREGAERFGARQLEALQNSVKINGIIRREFIAAVTGDKTDPYIGGNPVYGFRVIRDRKGIAQNVANVAYLPNGATRIFLMVTAPHNLSVNGIWKPYYGNDTKALAKLEAQRSTGSSTAMLEGLIRENIAKGGSGQMECAPLDLNKPLFQRAGFREGEDDEFILSPEAAKKFLDMRDRIHAKKDAADMADDQEAQEWQDELNALEEELGGMMALRPKKRASRPTADADDEKNTADYLLEVAQQQTAQDFKRWTDASLKWLKGFSTIEAMQQALAKPEKLYDALNPDPLENLLYQYMMLADLGGRVDVLDDDDTREDAAKPSWLKLPFAEAIAALRKRVTIPTNSYTKMSEGYHSWAFSVARMTKASLVDDAKYIVDKGVSDGYSYDQLTKMWQRLIGRKGWEATGSQVYTILDTNIRAAYSTGRAQQVFNPESMRDDDVIVWRHRDSRVPRPLHLALHDKAIAASDPFWTIAFPSCAWGCRCSAFKVSRGYAQRNGIEILSKPPDPNTIADPGFRFNRAGLSERDRQTIIDSTLSTLPPSLRRKVENDLKNQ